MPRSVVGALVAVAAVVLAGPAVATGAGSIGSVDTASGVWYLRDGAGASTVFYYGDPGDEPFLGDWDCDGVDTPGLHRRSDGRVYLRNSNSAGTADVDYFFGNPGDVALAGDFDGDGCDTVSIYRPSERRFFIINELGSATLGLGSADFSFEFGDAGDMPFAGDLDGDGADEVALHRRSTGRVYYRDSLTTGIAEHDLVWGDPGDVVFAGDWLGGGSDGLGAYRPRRGRYFLRNQPTAGSADTTVAYGEGSWVPVSGATGLGSAPTTRATLVVSAAGDVHLDARVIPDLSTYGFDHAWSGMRRQFLADDLTIVNLECTPSDMGSPVAKAYNFRCPSAAVATLAPNGIEVANMANNHAWDHGEAALLDGVATVAGAGVAPVGAGANVAAATAGAYFEINGWTVAVLGFNTVDDGVSRSATTTGPGLANGKDLTLVRSAVAAAKARADIVLVTVHWGIERSFVPDPADVPIAHAIVEAGADAILGHGAHRLQPLERYLGKPIFWSLGNFVWPRHDADSYTTAVAELVIQPDGLTFARLIPAQIATPGRPVFVD
jgi:poly-gamma-glutamate capsule biosynthesis protein CapA/YwtB (metallophosphatase superfamily)